MGKQWQTFIFLGSKITADGDCSHEIKRRLLLGRKVMTNLDSIWKSRDITLPTKIHLVKAMVFPVVMYGCESWTIKSTEELMLLNCGIGEDSWVPWTARRSNQSILYQSWVFIGRTDVEAETPIPWPPDAKSWLIWKDSDAGTDWGQEKGTTEDEMVEWHHWLDGHEFESTLGADDGQGGLVCCGSWGRKELDTTEQLKWTELKWTHSKCVINIIVSPTIFSFFLIEEQLIYNIMLVSGVQHSNSVHSLYSI